MTKQSTERRIAALEQRQAQAEGHLEVKELDGVDFAGRPLKMANVCWGDKPMARVAKELWEAL